MTQVKEAEMRETSNAIGLAYADLIASVKLFAAMGAVAALHKEGVVGTGGVPIIPDGQMEPVAEAAFTAMFRQRLSQEAIVAAVRTIAKASFDYTTEATLRSTCTVTRPELVQ